MNIRLDNTMYSANVTDMSKRILSTINDDTISEDNYTLKFRKEDNKEEATPKLTREEIAKIHDKATMNVDEVRNFLFMLIGAEVKVEENSKTTGVNFNKYV